MSNTKPHENLYNALNQQGYDIGDLEQFTEKLKDAQKRHALYDSISTEFNIGDFDNFENTINYLWNNEDAHLAGSSGLNGSSATEQPSAQYLNETNFTQPVIPEHFRQQSTQPTIDPDVAQNMARRAELTFQSPEQRSAPEVIADNAQTLANPNSVNAPTGLNGSAGSTAINAPTGLNGSPTSDQVATTPPGLTGSTDPIHEALSQHLIDTAYASQWQRDTEQHYKSEKERLQALYNKELAKTSGRQFSSSFMDYNPSADTAMSRDASLYSQALQYINDAEHHMSNVRNDAGLAQGVSDAIFDIDTLTLGLDSLSKNATLKAILDKADADQPLTQAEESLLNAALYKQFTEAALPNGRWYNVGRSIGEQVPYMLEFALSGGVAGALTKGASKAIGKQVVKYINNIALKNGSKIANRTARNIFTRGSRMLGNTLYQIPGGVMRAAAQTPLRSSVYNDIIERQIGTLGYSPSASNSEIGGVAESRGGLQYTGRIDADNTADAITKGLTSGFITNLTETIGGEGIQFITNKIGGLMGKGANAIFKNLQSPRWYNRLRESFRRNGFGEFVKATSWQGPVAEYGEELLDQTLNAIFVGDSSLDPNSENYVFNLDNLIDTAITTGAISLFMGAAGGIASGKIHRDVNKAFAQAEQNLHTLHYTDTEINALNNIATSRPQEASKWVSSITRTMRTLAIRSAEIENSLSPEARTLLAQPYTEAEFNELSPYDQQAVMALAEINKRFNDLTIQRDYVVAGINYNALSKGIKESVAPQAEAAMADIQANALRDSDYTIAVDFRGQKGYLVTGNAEVTQLPNGALHAELPAGSIYQVRTKSPDGQWVIQQAVAEDLVPGSVTPTQQLIDETTARIYTPVQNLINAEQAQAQAEVTTPPLPEGIGEVSPRDGGVYTQSTEAQPLSTEQTTPTTEQPSAPIGLNGLNGSVASPTSDQVSDQVATTPTGLNAPTGSTEQASGLSASPTSEQVSDQVATTPTGLNGPTGSTDQASGLNGSPGINTTTTSPTSPTSEVTTPPLPEGIGEVSPRDGGVYTQPTEAQPLSTEAQPLSTEAQPLSTISTQAKLAHINAWQQAIDVPIVIFHDISEVDNPQAVANIQAGNTTPGWITNGTVYIYLPHAKDERDIDATIMHECIAHFGIPRLFATQEQADAFYNEVWNAMPEAEQRRFLRYPGVSHRKGDDARRAAADEYIAHLAEQIRAKRAGEAEVSLWQRIVAFFRNALRRAKVNLRLNDTDLTQLLLQSLDALKKNNEQPQDTTSDNALDPNEVAVTLPSNGTETRFSIRSFREEGRAKVTNWLDSKVADKEITRQEAQDIIDQLDTIYDICQEYTTQYAPFGEWSEAQVDVDANGNPILSVIKSNNDYAMNLDFSLVCKKRRTLDAVFQEMIARDIINDFELDGVQVAKVNEIIRSYGFETACRLCFVDAKRFRIAAVADTFVKLFNELSSMSDRDLRKILSTEPKTVRGKTAKLLLNDPSQRIKVSRADFISSDGFERIKREYPEIMKLYNSKKGSNGPKASFGDVQYLNDIEDTSWTPDDAYAVGGVRLQSFSDYVPRMVFDYVQMIADLAAKRLPVHAYTKEDIFAKQFGLTGIKINLSLVPRVDPDGIAPGLDRDGNYVWQEGETFPYEDAIALQNAPGYRDNCGTIAVGVSDAHILKMLDDENIRMVIPYHKSGLNPAVAKFNRIGKFVDYTLVQNTRYANGKKLSKEDLKTHFNFNEALRMANGNPRIAAQQYLDWCRDNNYLPKFDKFASHPNYYKLLEDFTTMYTVDGVDTVVPQHAVEMRFPTEQDAFGSMRDLIAEGLEADAILEGQRNEQLSAIVDEIAATLPPKTKAKAKAKTKTANSQQTTTPTGLNASAGSTGLNAPDIRFRIGDNEQTALLNAKQPKTIQPLVDIAIADTRFRITKRTRETIDTWLNRRTDLNTAERNAFWTYIENEEPAKQLAMGKWFANGAIRLPEDQPTVDDAMRMARKMNIDPLQYNAPGLITSEYHERFGTQEQKETLLSPDDERFAGILTNKVDYGNGITVYTVQDDAVGQDAVRTLMNDHLGKNFNCWCLLYADSNGNITESARNTYWKHYSSIPKRVAFKDGKICSFCASNNGRTEWWDLSDRSHGGNIPVEMELPGDSYGRRSMYEYNDKNDKLTRLKGSPIFRGNKKNGRYEEWYNEDSHSLSIRANYKGGKLHGLYESWYENGQPKVRATYKDGFSEGLYEEWHENGQLYIRENYKDGKRNGLREVWHKNGQPTLRETYKGGESDDLHEEWYNNGQLRIRYNYKKGKRDGLSEEWYYNGQLRIRESYKNGQLDDLREEWFEDGQIKLRVNFKDGKFNGLYETWHDNGQLSVRTNYVNGDHDGIHEEWHENGQLYIRDMFKNGRREGLFEAWNEDGQLIERANFKNDLRDGLYEEWFGDGQPYSRKSYINDELNGLYETWHDNGQLAIRTNYINGNPEGLYEEWYENGQLKVRRNYKDGKLNGYTEKWDKSGHLIEKSEYVKGVLLHSLPTTSFRSINPDESLTHYARAIANSPSARRDRGSAVGEGVDNSIRTRTIDGLNAPVALASANDKNKLPDTPIRFRMTRRTESTVNGWINRRTDLTPDEKKAVIDHIDNLDGTTLQLATAKWFAQGTIRIPEDNIQVEQAIKVAARAKVDPLAYDYPQAIISAFPEATPKQTPINPDDVPTLHDKQELPNGLTVYTVDESRESQQAVREIINTHLGNHANPWCVTSALDNQLTDESWEYWQSYTSHPKRIAFHNGKVVAFFASDNGWRIWWDTQDRPHFGIPFSANITDGEYNEDNNTIDTYDADGNLVESIPATSFRSINPGESLTHYARAIVANSPDTRFRTSSEIEAEYPNWLDGTTTDSGKHFTQVEGTRKTYKKVGDWIEQNLGKDIAILDASSGMGYGTADLRERGFNIDDVEPYQSEERRQNNPATFDSYDSIDKQYDFIISNAVLNVIPDDWRAGLLHDMAEHLAPGGRMFINTRKAGEEKSIKDKIELDSPQEILVKRNGRIASYQRFFTPSELKEWVQQELGEGYTVEIANKANSGTSGLAAVVVTKNNNTRFRSIAADNRTADIALDTIEQATADYADTLNAEREAIIDAITPTPNDSPRTIAEKTRFRSVGGELVTRDNTELEDFLALANNISNAMAENDARHKHTAIAESQYDSMQRLHNLLDDLRKQGALIDERFDPWLTQNQSRSRAQAETKVFDLTYRQPLYEAIARGIRRLFPGINTKDKAENAKGYSHLSLYAQARTAIERQEIKSAQARAEAEEKGEEYKERDFGGLAGIQEAIFGLYSAIDEEVENAKGNREKLTELAIKRGIPTVKEFVDNAEAKLGNPDINGTAAHQLWTAIRSISEYKLATSYLADITSRAGYQTLTYGRNIDALLRERYDMQVKQIKDHPDSYDNVTDYDSDGNATGTRKVLNDNARIALANLNQEYIDAINAVPMPSMRGDSISSAGSWQQLIDTGWLTEEEVNALHSYYMFYMPLKGHAELTAEDINQYQQKTPRNQSKIKAVKGHSHLAKDPFNQLILDTHGVIQSAEQNRWRLNLYNILTNNPNPSQYVVEQRFYKVETKTDGSKEYVPYGTTETINGVQVFIPGHPTAEELANGTAVAYSNRNTRADVDIPISSDQRKEHSVTVLVGGEAYTMFFYDKRIADAINGTNIKRPSDWWKQLDKLQALNRLYAGLKTSLNPTFTLISNLPRDWMEMVSNNLIEHGFAHAVTSFIYRVRATRAGDVQKAIRKHQEGKLLTMADATTDVERYVVEFFNNGGSVNITQLPDYNTAKVELMDDLNTYMRTGEMPKGGWLSRSFNDMAERVELAPRIATYIASREIGRNISQSVNDAKEATVNFDRKGSWSGIMGMFQLFYNAAAQSVRRQIGLARRHPVRFAATYATIGFLSPLNNILMSYIMSILLGDDDDLESIVRNYFAINPELRRRYNIILIGNDYIRIPMAVNYLPYVTLGDVIANWRLNPNYRPNVLKDTLDIASAILDTFLPSMIAQPIGFAFDAITAKNNEESANASRAMVFSLLNKIPVIEPLMQAFGNYNFMGSTLFDMPYDKNSQEPAYLRARQYTQPVWVWASHLLNDITGGNEVHAGWLNIAPEQIENVMSVFGGYGEYAENIISLGIETVSILSGEKPDTEVFKKSFPLLSRLYGGNTQERYDKSMQSMFYDDTTALAQYAEYRKNATTASTRADFDRTYSPDEQRYFADLATMESIAKKIRTEIKAATPEGEAPKYHEDERLKDIYNLANEQFHSLATGEYKPIDNPYYTYMYIKDAIEKTPYRTADGSYRLLDISGYTRNKPKDDATYIDVKENVSDANDKAIDDLVSNFRRATRMFNRLPSGYYPGIELDKSQSQDYDRFQEELNALKTSFDAINLNNLFTNEI